MRIVGPDGTSFTLTIVGYELEYPIADAYDANRLVVRVEITAAGGSWTASGACLLTWEVEHLAGWLDGLAHGKTHEPVLQFTEPHLLFRHVDRPDGRSAIRVHFAEEFLPPWKPSKALGEEDPYVEFPAAELPLRAAARSLQEQLRRFPPRGTA